MPDHPPPPDPSGEGSSTPGPTRIMGTEPRGEQKGQVINLGEEKHQFPGKISPAAIAKHRADTARWLAYASLVLLALLIVGHYVTIVLLISGGTPLELTPLNDIFDASLPIVSGLAGGATAYFFTRER